MRCLNCGRDKQSVHGMYCNPCERARQSIEVTQHPRISPELAAKIAAEIAAWVDSVYLPDENCRESDGKKMAEIIERVGNESV